MRAGLGLLLLLLLPQAILILDGYMCANGA
jgi:hypothetical protein